MNEELVAAIQAGNLETVIKCVSLGADLKYKDPDTGNTALHWASSYPKSNLAIVKHLVSKGADLKAKNDDNNTPLLEAAIAGQRDVVQFYICDAKVDPNEVNKDRETAMILAATHGQLEVLRYLLEDAKADPKRTTSIEQDAFMCAIWAGHVHIVQYFLGKPNVTSCAKLYDKDARGDTALHLASREGNREILELLLQKIKNDLKELREVVASHLQINSSDVKESKESQEFYAIINAENKQGYSPCFVAAANDRLEIVSLFIEMYGIDIRIKNEAKYSLMHVACKRGHLNIVRYIKKKIDEECQRAHSPNHQTAVDPIFLEEDPSNEGYAPISLAVLSGNMDLVQFLIECKVDVTVKTKIGSTLLHLAAFANHLDLYIDLAKKHGFDENAVNNLGITPFILAVKKGNTDIIKHCLQQRKIDILQTDKNNNTLFHLASRFGHLKILQLFNNINDKEWQDKIETAKRSCNIDGETPLLCAIEKDHLEVVQYWASEDQNAIYAQNKKGETALHYAARYMHKRIVCFLLEKGVYIDITSTNGLTPWALLKDLPDNEKNEQHETLSLLGFENTLMWHAESSQPEKESLKCVHSLLYELEVVNARRIIDGNTALQLAVIHNKELLVEEFLINFRQGRLRYIRFRDRIETTINTTLKNNAGQSAYQLAMSSSSLFIKGLFELNRLSCFVSDFEKAREKSQSIEQAQQDNKTTDELKNLADTDAQDMASVVEHLITIINDLNLSNENINDDIKEDDESEERLKITVRSSRTNHAIRLLNSKLAILLSDPSSPIFNAVLAYERCINLIENGEKRDRDVQEAHDIIVKLLFAGYIVLTPKDNLDPKKPQYSEETLVAKPCAGIFALPTASNPESLKLMAIRHRELLHHISMGTPTLKKENPFAKLCLDYIFEAGAVTLGTHLLNDPTMKMMQAISPEAPMESFHVILNVAYEMNKKNENLNKELEAERHKSRRLEMELQTLKQENLQMIKSKQVEDLVKEAEKKEVQDVPADDPALGILKDIAQNGLMTGEELSNKTTPYYRSSDDKPSKSVHVNAVVLEAALQHFTLDKLSDFLISNDHAGMMSVVMERSYVETVSSTGEIGDLLKDRVKNSVIFILDGEKLIGDIDKKSIAEYCKGVVEKSLDNIHQKHFKSMLVPEHLCSEVEKIFPLLTIIKVPNKVLSFAPSHHVYKNFTVKGLDPFETMRSANLFSFEAPNYAEALKQYLETCKIKYPLFHIVRLPTKPDLEKAVKKDLRFESRMNELLWSFGTSTIGASDANASQKSKKGLGKK